MDVAWFFRERTRFIRFTYERAAKPFIEMKQQMEGGFPPFDDPPYSEDPEPPFMAEWSDAETAIVVLGRSCVSMLSARAPSAGSTSRAGRARTRPRPRRSRPSEMSRRGKTRDGKAWQGMAGRGVEGNGGARRGQARRGPARRGMAGRGKARQGRAWRGWARPCEARRGKHAAEAGGSPAQRRMSRAKASALRVMASPATMSQSIRRRSSASGAP